MTDALGTSSLLAKIGEFEEALATNPASEVFVPLADAYRRMGLLDEAVAAIEKGLMHHPELSPAYIALGRILAQQGELEQAVDAFEVVRKKSPDNPLALKGLAKVRLLQKKPQMAIPLVKQLMQTGVNDPEVAKLKAGCEAQVAAQSKDVARPNKAPIKTATMVDIYLKQGLLDDALALCREILTDDPGNLAVSAKVAEIESRLVAGEPAPQADVPAENPAMEEAREANVSAAASSRLVTLFERWLDAINRRRAHVR